MAKSLYHILVFFTMIEVHSSSRQFSGTLLAENECWLIWKVKLENEKITQHSLFFRPSCTSVFVPTLTTPTEYIITPCWDLLSFLLAVPLLVLCELLSLPAPLLFPLPACGPLLDLTALTMVLKRAMLRSESLTSCSLLTRWVWFLKRLRYVDFNNSY